MSSSFLRDFKARREAAILKSAATAAVEKPAPKATNSIVKMREPDNDITLGYIIENKPGKKEVTEYLSRRRDEILEQMEESD